MRSARFFIISLTLHAAALVYVIALYQWQPARPIPVTILPIEPEVDIVRNYSGNGSGERRNQQPAHRTNKRSPQSEQRLPDTDKVSEPTAHPSVVEINAKDIEVNMVQATSTGGAEVASSAPGSGAAGHSGSGLPGSGSASGPGRGSSPRTVITTPARYSDTPKPAYPESARREGREGRVLLRVLIDDQGEAKTVEVSRSSGSDALDQAATSAIKRWRFHPARAGDQPIESWVSVPIDFRLTDAKN